MSLRCGYDLFTCSRLQPLCPLCVCCSRPGAVWDNHIQRLYAWTLYCNEGNLTRETTMDILVS